MKTTTRFAAMTLGLTLGAGIVTAPLAAHASEEGKRNTALALGATAAALLLTQKNKLPGVVVAGAAVIAASQLGNDRRDHYRHDDYGYDDSRYHDDYGYGRNDSRHHDEYRSSDYRNDSYRNDGYRNGRNDARDHADYRADNSRPYSGSNTYSSNTYSGPGANGANASGYRVGQNGPNRYDDNADRATHSRTVRAFGGTR